ncbi:MAG TPA: glycosyltransferase [Solirubrobacteraceae bacterium]
MSTTGAGSQHGAAVSGTAGVEPADDRAQGTPGTRTSGAVDVLIVSLGSTAGLRAADDELADSLRRAGARVALVRAAPPRRLRTLALTDLAWALAARRAAQRGLAEHAPRALIYSSTTAALLWPAPGAIRFDAPSAGNRPGRHGLWQRPLERRRLARTPLLLPWSEGALLEAPAAARHGDRALVLPVPVEPYRPAAPPRDIAAASVHAVSARDIPAAPTPTALARDITAAPARDIAAITYAANPLKKGLDRVLIAWTRARRADEQLYIAGASPAELARAGIVLPSTGVTLTGPLAPADYRSLLRRARVFVCAPRREDYGLAQLEALADGCLLLTTPAPGPYAALPLARALDPSLVTDDLAPALRLALDEPAADYHARATRALSTFTRACTDRLVAGELLPRLLSLSHAHARAT